MTDTGRTSQLDTLSQANQKTIDNIFDLMRQEGDLFKSLQGMDKTPEEKEEIINRINQLSELRLSLHETLKDVYAYYQSNVGAARTTLGQQLFAMGIIETELDEVKRRLNDIEGKKQNKLRLVQINTYYGKRYSAQKKMLITIIIVSIILFFIAFLRNRLGVLPDNVTTLLMGITIATGVIYLGIALVDFKRRDNMNFDEYNWAFDKSKAPTGEGDGKNPWGRMGIECIGAQCCDDTSEYRYDLSKCIPKTTTLTEEQAAKYAKQSDLYSGLGSYSLSKPNAVTRLPGNEVSPTEAKKDTFSNYASV